MYGRRRKSPSFGDFFFFHPFSQFSVNKKSVYTVCSVGSYKNMHLKQNFFSIAFFFLLLAGVFSLPDYVFAQGYSDPACRALAPGISGVTTGNGDDCPTLFPGTFKVGSWLASDCTVMGACCSRSTPATPPPACTPAACTGECKYSCGTGSTPIAGVCQTGLRCCSTPTCDGVCVGSVSQTCGTFNRKAATGSCAVAGQSCCSSQQLTPCAGQCRNVSGSCATGEIEDGTSICTSSYDKCCVVGLPLRVTGKPLEEYKLLETIPGSTTPANESGRLSFFLQDIYRFAFWAVGIATVLMLTIGGFMYLTSAGNTSRIGTAKTIIWDAFLGLILALVSWLFLNIINPDLVNLTLPKIRIASPPPIPPTPPAAGTLTKEQCDQANGRYEVSATLCTGAGEASLGNYVNDDTPPKITGVCCSAAPPASALTTLQALAQTILSGTPGVTVAGSGECNGTDGAPVSPRRSLQEAAAGSGVTYCHPTCKTTGPCTGSTTLNAAMLSKLISLGQKYPFTITSLTGGQHSETSRHYSGQAVDIVPAPSVPKSDWPLVAAFFRSGLYSTGGAVICDIRNPVGPGTINVPCDDARADHIHIQYP